MDLLGALSQAANVTRPSVRDRLPVMAIALVAYFLSLAGVPARFDARAALDSLTNLDASGILLVSLLLVAASILFEPLLSGVDQALKGRIPGPAGRVARSRQRQRRKKLFYEADNVADEARRAARVFEDDYEREQSESFAELRFRGKSAWNRTQSYPETSADIVGSALGNVLAAGESRAGGRYGLWTSVALPRLRPLLPDATATELRDSEDALRFNVRMGSASLLIATGFIGVALMMIRQVPWFAIVGTGIFLIMAFSSYRSAIAAASRYNEALAVVFDLHRFLLYDCLYMPRPSNTLEEVKASGTLMEALNRPLDFCSRTYEKKPPP